MVDSEPTSPPEQDAPRRHGRRARILSEEEKARLEQERTAREKDLAGGDTSSGEASAPTGSDPVQPSVRKYGRRARIIEIEEPVEEQAEVGSAASDTSDGADMAVASEDIGPSEATSARDDEHREDVHSGEASAPSADDEPSEASIASDDDADDSVAGEGSAASETSASTDDSPASTDEETSDTTTDNGSAESADASAEPVVASAEPAVASATSTTASSAATSTVIERDADGAELGELTVSDAPAPRPSPRFEGRVLHRPERTSGNAAVWAIWALIAVAIIVLIILLIIGVLGPGTDSGQAAALAHSLDPLLPTGEAPRL